MNTFLHSASSITVVLLCASPPVTVKSSNANEVERGHCVVENISINEIMYKHSPFATNLANKRTTIGQTTILNYSVVIDNQTFTIEQFNLQKKLLLVAHLISPYTASTGSWHRIQTHER